MEHMSHNISLWTCDLIRQLLSYYTGAVDNKIKAQKVIRMQYQITIITFIVVVIWQKEHVVDLTGHCVTRFMLLFFSWALSFVFLSFRIPALSGSYPLTPTARSITRLVEPPRAPLRCNHKTMKMNIKSETIFSSVFWMNLSLAVTQILPLPRP